jgi:O-antigen/teichoic acid export membrane protein
MTIFVQMFRYAAEPFFFNEASKANKENVYGNVLKYFTFFLMVIFLSVSLGIDFFKLFIDKDYHEGLRIVPIVLLANVLVGLLFNVNMWYKLSGNTMYGVYITGLGAVITIVLNIIFIPLYGYFACAWIHLLSNAVMLFLTYYFGQRIYKIEYDVKSVGFYIVLGLIFYIAGILLQSNNSWLNIILGAIFVTTYIYIGNKREHLTDIFLRKNAG